MLRLLKLLRSLFKRLLCTRLLASRHGRIAEAGRVDDHELVVVSRNGQCRAHLFLVANGRSRISSGELFWLMIPFEY